MSIPRFLLAAVLLPAPWMASAAEAGDADRGRIIAGVRCMPCHHLHLESKLIGPGLKGIFNRVPRIAGVPFERWDDASLEAWLKAPRSIKPNTTMAIPPIAERDRTDLIAYFKRDENSEAADR
ncbi:MAG: hypothetical protein AUK36_04390 [Zetaproteobacteria bacterium CG2_30_59_37]|nr:MAG: hypothetical protein AUK36_04390 [Zetaproteobacteria bacterium CG2_30_59_37]